MKYQYIDFKKTNKIGSNQFQAKKKIKDSTYWNLLFLPLIFGICFSVKSVADEVTNVVPAHAEVISPLPKAPEPKIKWQFVQSAPTSEHDQIKSYIQEVFGSDSDKAFKLLSCENSSLNPDAVNDNTKWGGVGKDWGVFQINDTWQKVQAKFLLNWRVNVQIAKQLFDENNGHFNLWTCGKNLGI